MRQVLGTALPGIDASKVNDDDHLSMRTYGWRANDDSTGPGESDGSPGVDHVDCHSGRRRPAPSNSLATSAPSWLNIATPIHGPDAEHREAELRLDTHEGLLAPRDGQPAVKVRDADASELIRRVVAEADDERMPPAKSGPRLKPEQIDILRRWIAQGADWQSHWSFEPVKRPPLPAVRDAAWPRNPVDHFILARLEPEGLKPNAEADKRTLGRHSRLGFNRPAATQPLCWTPISRATRPKPTRRMSTSY